MEGIDFMDQQLSILFLEIVRLEKDRPNLGEFLVEIKRLRICESEEDLRENGCTIIRSMMANSKFMTTTNPELITGISDLVESVVTMLAHRMRTAQSNPNPPERPDVLH